MDGKQVDEGLAAFQGKFEVALPTPSVAGAADNTCDMPRASSSLRNETLAPTYCKMAEAAALAPSAENTQPWHFIVYDDGLTICLDRTRALSSDIDFMLDLTSLGACTENAIIAARQDGFEPTISGLAGFRQIQSTAGLVPVLQLKCSQPSDTDPLFGHLVSRCTSRRMESTKIPQTQLDALTSEVDSVPGVQIDWVDGRKQWKGVAKMVGIGNRIRFEYQPFHQEFYNKCSDNS